MLRAARFAMSSSGVWHRYVTRTTCVQLQRLTDGARDLRSLRDRKSTVQYDASGPVRYDDVRPAKGQGFGHVISGWRGLASGHRHNVQDHGAGCMRRFFTHGVQTVLALLPAGARHAGPGSVALRSGSSQVRFPPTPCGDRRAADGAFFPLHCWWRPIPDSAGM